MRWAQAVLVGFGMMWGVAVGGRAEAVQVSWSNVATDLVVTSARPCTLVVRGFSIADVPAGGWKVVWRGYAAGAAPLRLVSVAANAAGLNACGVKQRADLASHIAGADSAVFCRSGAAADSAEVRYVFTVHDGARARLTVLGMGGQVLGGSGPAATAGEVTLNGGLPVAYAPVLSSCRTTRADETVQFRVVGAFLKGVRWVRYRAPGNLTIRCRIDSSSASSLTASLALRHCLPAGVLEVGTAGDERGALAVPGENPDDPGCTKWQALVVRFRSGRIDPAIGATEGPLSTFRSADAGLLSRLQTAGVTALRRLHPEFRHEDVHTTNFLGEPIELVDLADIYVASVAEDRTLAAVQEVLENSSDVLYAYHDASVSQAFDPNDPLFTQQWGLHNTGAQVCTYPAYPNIDLGVQSEYPPSVWDATRGADIPIAILDTGLDLSHQDLPEPSRVPWPRNFVTGGQYIYDDSEYRHGTAVAGIAAARMNNGLGIAGTAPEAAISPMKVLDYQGLGETDSVTSAIKYTTAWSVPVVNLSLGVFEGWVPEGVKRNQADACLNAFYRGQLLVASSGNLTKAVDGSETPVPAYPAAFGKRVYAVGAMLPDAMRWRDALIRADYCATHPYACFFSNFGPWLDCVAPGGRFIVTCKDGPSGYYTLDACNPNDFSTMAFGGTSAAAPFVSGVAALLLKLNPNLIGEDIQELINRTANSLSYGGGFTDQYGHGYVRADLAKAKLDGREVFHFAVGDVPWALGPLTDVEQTDVSIFFLNVQQWFPSPSSYPCRRHRLTASVQWPHAFPDLPTVWTRSSGSLGWRSIGPLPDYFDYEKDVYEGGVVGGTVSQTGGTFETYVYEVYYNGAYHWWPTDPSHARLMITALGGLANTGLPGPTVASVTEVRSFPNPARSGVQFDVSVPERGLVRAVVLDAQGRQVAVVANEMMEAGRRRFAWGGRMGDGQWAPAGVYFCKVRSSGGQAARRFVLLGANRE